MNREYLMARLRYDPETGKLWWREHAALPPKWRGRFAGKEAFTAKSHGYHVGRVDGVKYYAHRIAFLIHYGEQPEQIDHVNHDRSDNKASNLRAASPAINSQNAPLSPLNTSGVTGVSIRPSGRWCARICANRTRKYLGTFDTFQEAVAARKAAEEHFGFHENHGRGF